MDCRGKPDNDGIIRIVDRMDRGAALRRERSGRHVSHIGKALVVRLRSGRGVGWIFDFARELQCSSHRRYSDRTIPAVEIGTGLRLGGCGLCLFHF
jgi:hypothetical protein